MRKIKLDEYKSSSIYLNFFDILIKDNYSNKELFLESINISPSSYRRAKLDLSKTSDKIAPILCEKFNISMLTNEEIDVEEKFLSDIYNNIYYRIEFDIKLILNQLDEKININNVFRPIYDLFYLFVICYSSESPKLLIEKYKDFFVTTKKYKKYFNPKLQSLLNQLKVVFLNVENKDFLCSNDNELIFQVLGTKAFLNGRYIESIYYCNEAKKMFLNKLNFKRVQVLNLTLLCNYNSLMNYKEAYELSVNQINSFNAYRNYDDIYKLSKIHFLNSCLALGKYKEILESNLIPKKLSKLELIVLMISTNNLSYKDFDYSCYIYDKELFIDVDTFLKCVNINNFDKFKNYNLNETLLKIIKMKFIKN